MPSRALLSSHAAFETPQGRHGHVWAAGCRPADTSSPWPALRDQELAPRALKLMVPEALWPALSGSPFLSCSFRDATGPSWPRMGRGMPFSSLIISMAGSQGPRTGSKGPQLMVPEALWPALSGSASISCSFRDATGPSWPRMGRGMPSSRHIISMAGSQGPRTGSKGPQAHGA